MTADCILSVREHTDVDYELIVVDNGSEPPLDTPFTGFTKVTLLRNEANEGFPKAVNQGIDVSGGGIIVLLNNDVVCTPGWASGLVSWLDEFDIVGPVTSYAAGIQRVQAPFYQSKEALDDVAEEWAEQYEGEAIEVNWVIGFCMAFKREVYDKVGPFDESLWPCSGEEIQFCLNARKAGYRIGVAGDVYVHHEGSQTFKQLHEAGVLDYGQICERDTKHIEAKHGEFWSRQLVGDPNDSGD
jgi:GT2 family glycosyltransferase